MNLENRRKRLQEALKSLPYKNYIGYSPEQECIQEIIAKLSAHQKPIASTSEGLAATIEPIIPVCDIIKKYKPDILKKETKSDNCDEKISKENDRSDNNVTLSETKTSILPVASIAKVAKNTIVPTIPTCDIILTFRPDLNQTKSEVDRFAEKVFKKINRSDNDVTLSETKTSILAVASTLKAAKVAIEIPIYQKEPETDKFAKKVFKEIDRSNNNVKPSETLTSIFLGTAKVEEEIKRQNDAGDSDGLLDQVELKEMELNDMDTLIKHRIEIIQRWERDRSNVLELLAIEVSKVKALEKKVLKSMDEMNLKNVKRMKLNNQEFNESTNTTKRIFSDLEKNIALHQTHKNKFLNEGFDFALTGNSEMVLIGPNGTKVSRNALNQFNWCLSGAAITRKLLCEIFDHETLAFASLSGKPSPAFVGCDKQKKTQLDPMKIADLTFFLTNKLDMTAREVRNTITIKCADENKQYRKRMKKLNGTGNK